MKISKYIYIVLISCNILLFPQLTINAQEVTVGTGAGTSLYSPYMPSWPGYKQQYIYTASRLTSAGLPSGAQITALAFNIATKNSTQPFPGFTIYIGHTSNNTFSSTSFFTPSLTQVYSANYSTVAGWNTHNFSSAFTWNGTDNILIQICWEGKTQESSTYDNIYRENYSNTQNRAGSFSADPCNLTTGTLDDELPNIKFTYTLQPIISITDITEDAGNSVAVTVNAENVTDLMGFQWTIEYDNTKLEYVNCSNWDSEITATILINSTTQPGKLMFSCNNFPNTFDIANGKFFDINFNILPGATGTACLSWADSPTSRELSNAIPDVVPATWNNGCVTIIQVPNLVITDGIIAVANEPVTVPVNAINLSGIVAFQWTIEYDASKLIYNNCTNWATANGVNAAGVQIFNDAPNGKLMFSYNNDPTPVDIANGKFFDINFTVKPDVSGDACFAWADKPTERELSNSVPATVTGIWTNGCISIILEGYYWNGSVSTDWQNLLNWTPNKVPDNTDNIIIPEACPYYPVVDDGTTTAECLNMTIVKYASVTIATNGQMTVTGYITNSEGAAGLIVKSDASGTGSLIINNSGVTATCERYLAGEKWNFIFSPLDNAETADITTTSGNIQNPNFYKYVEEYNDYWNATTNFTLDNPGWNSPSETIMSNNYGYIHYSTENKIYEILGGNLFYNSSGKEFTNLSYSKTADGSINVTDIPVGSSTDMPWSTYDGWNYIGNSFTSAINWNIVSSTASNLNNVQNGFYVYDGVAKKYKFYGGGSSDCGISDLAVNDATNIIPANQGFFVKVATEGTGSVTIPLNARTHNNLAFYKNDEIIPDLLTFRIQKDNYFDETIIRSFEFASFNYDANVDALKMFAWDNDKPQIFTFTDDSHFLIINSTPKITEATEIPVGIYCGAAGNHKIVFTANNYKYSTLYLEDKLLGTFTEIFEGTEYNFTSVYGVITDRFSIHFNKEITDLQDVENTTDFEIYPNPTTGYITLVNNVLNENSTFEIFDISGKLIFKDIIISTNTKIDLSDYKKGIYLISVKSENFIENKLIILQ